MTDNTLDQAEVITRMSDYLTANRDKIKAIIGLGDLVTGSIKRVFDQVGVKAGRDPGGRLGQLARHDPGGPDGLRQRRACGRTRRRPAISASRWPPWRARGIPPGFNIITGALYEKDKAQFYHDIMSGK